MQICPNCGSQQVDGAVFCDECGTKLAVSPVPAPPPASHAPTVVAAHCPACGTPVMPGEAFCPNCGAALGQAAYPPTPPGAYQAPPQIAIPGPELGIAPQSCPQCGTPLEPGSLFCDMCGTPVGAAPPGVPSPAYAPPPPPAEMYGVPPYQPPVSVPPVPMAIRGRLVVQATNATLPFPPGRSEIIIGREDPVNNIFPDIDLTDHGGDEGGVSRRHARVYMRGDQFFIEDLNSTNYTYVNQEKLAPGQPHPLNNGDEIRLGKVRLNFYM